MALQANELRIGNWVNFYHSISGETKPMQIDWGWFGSDADQKDSTPIPITPKVLENCGFEYDTDDNCYIFESEKGFSISHLIGGLTHYYGNLECMWTDVHQEIQYLHQLQNLYFSLVGEELEITFKK